MNYPFYNFETSDNHTFYFESISNKSIIPKAVVFTPIFQDSDVYYLGFGDIHQDGTIDDLRISDNKDVEKVLATVIQTILVFLETYPDKKVFFEGSTKARTRLYQIVINKDFDMITRYFSVQGLTAVGFESYRKNVNYEGFLIQLSNSTHGNNN